MEFGEQIVNYGIATSLVEKTLKLARVFFDLRSQEKVAMAKDLTDPWGMAMAGNFACQLLPRRIGKSFSSTTYSRPLSSRSIPGPTNRLPTGSMSFPLRIGKS